MANYLRVGFWNDFLGGASQRYYNIDDSGTGANFGTIFYNVTWSPDDSDGISAARQVLAREACNLYEAVLGIDFVETTSTSDAVDLFFGDNVAGQAYCYSQMYSGNSGPIDYSVVNIDSAWDGGSSTIGDDSFFTFLHEIGHGLGLGHQGNYNAGAGTPTYDNSAIWSNDTWQQTMMSYWPQSNYLGASYAFLTSPMAVDWIALNDLYAGQGFGATTFGTSRAFNGNTIYGVGTNITTSAAFAGLATYAANNAFNIVDGSGIDTVDFSNYAFTQVINLSEASAGSTEGSISSVGGRAGNMTIAVGTIIENATTGSGNDQMLGNSANNVLNGNSGNDTVDGGSGDDLIFLGGGDDFVDAISGGNDTFYGGTGNDYIYGYTGNETYFGEDGNDSLLGDSGNDTINGGASNDYIDGGDGNDTVDGGEGDDLIFLENGNDYVNIFSGGNDTFYGGSGNDYIYGYTGKETYFGGDGNDTLLGHGGNDTINAGSGVDSTNGGVGNDRIIDDDGVSLDIHDGSTGTDTIDYSRVTLGSISTINLATSTTSVVLGTTETISGFENVQGSQGGETIVGNTLRNILNGNSGNDTILSGLGNDNVSGGTGNDSLLGEVGNDTLLGGSGRDILIGGGDGDVDVLTSGNTGDQDTFVLGTSNEVLYDSSLNNDYARITDFDITGLTTQTDRIQLKGNSGGYRLGDILSGTLPGGFSGAGIFSTNNTALNLDDDNLIGLVQSFNSNSLNLANTAQFVYTV